MILASSIVLLAVPAPAAVTTTVGFSATPVADAHLDGDPLTGAWSDVTPITIPLENGANAPYGSATLYAKHDGTYVYFRIDGSIDVPWTSVTTSYFWLGMQISPSSTTHHSGGTWDGTFFGLWDGTDYAPQPTYPPSPVDTNSFTRPPLKDASQDAVGKLRYAGSAAPYAFTAEWKKKLNTGDASDIAFAPDGTTAYNFFVTTDSNGRGSLGGSIDHSAITNANLLRFAQVQAPIQVRVRAPWSQLYVGQTMQLTVLATVADAPIAGAQVTASVSGSGTLTPASGVTDASGLWTTVLRADSGSAGTTLGVSVVATMAPYAPGSGSYPVNVVPTPLALSVAVTSKTTRMMSLETATLRVRLTTTGGAGVTAGLLTTTSTPTGTFSAVTELGGGDYSVQWSAPTVTGTTVAAIRVTAKVGGYASPPQPTTYTITVDPNKTNPGNPTTLFALGLPAKSALRSTETILVRVYLYTLEGYPVAGASLALTVLGGGTVTAVVDELNGLYTFSYTAPTVTGDLAVLLRVTASKDGYRSVVKSIGLSVAP